MDEPLSASGGSQPDEEQPPRAPWGVLRLLETTGWVLTLQGLFLLTAWPLVTALPAAIALQRCLPSALAGDHPQLSRPYFTAFLLAARRGWPLAVAVPILLGLGAFGAVFWSTAQTSLALPALAVLAVIFGLGLATTLAVIAVAASAGPEHGWRQWSHEIPAALAGSPLRVAGAIVLFLTWIGLSLKLPTVALIGCGVVPGLLIHWAFPTHRAAPTPDQGSGADGGL